MRKKVISIRLSPETEREIKILAQEEGTTVSTLIERAIRLFSSFQPLMKDHDPDKVGIHHYLFLADEEERKRTKKPLTLSFIQNRKIPEDISPEELRELEEGLEERLSPGEVIGTMWKDLFDSSEEALASIAYILSQEMGFDPDRFVRKLKELQEASLPGEETKLTENGPFIFGILKGDEDILKFLKAKEKDAIKGTREFIELLKTLSQYKMVIYKEGNIVKEARFTSLDQAENAVLKEGYSKGEIEYSLMYEGEE